MLVSFILILISLIFYVTIEHYAGTYAFLSSWLKPMGWLFIATVIIFIIFVVVDIINKISHGKK